MSSPACTISSGIGRSSAVGASWVQRRSEVRAEACSRADSVCMMVAMALKLHILEPGLSFVLGTMEVVMQFKCSCVESPGALPLFSCSPIMLC